MTDDIVTRSPWREWRDATPARLALGRAGAGMPTDEVLRFGWAHAMARDAIHAALDIAALEACLRADGWEVTRVRSRAPDRATYLRRPDLGRQLDAQDAQDLRALAGPPCDLCIVIGDGLSSLAVARHAVPLLAALRPHLPAHLRIAPLVIASQARVALADEVGELFGARLSVMLIGERPGLSSPDSLGIYITHSPRRGRSDAERNCISNVRPEGLAHGLAAFRLAWLLRESLRRGLTGVELKDESDLAVLAPKAAGGAPAEPMPMMQAPQQETPMTARYPMAELKDLPDDIRKTVLEVQEKAGFVPNVFLALARRPAEWRAFFAYHDALMLKEEGSLTKGDREMIVTVTSAANQCLYCVVAHGALLRIYEKKPLVADQVAVNYRKADITPRQRAMLDFAMKVCERSHEIDESDFTPLHAHGFSDEDIWDIAAITSFFGLSNRMASFSGMQPNAEFFLMGRVPREKK